MTQSLHRKTSSYNQSANLAEHQLAAISKTMCYAKWAQVSLHLTNGMTNSCYHPPLHKINVEDIRKNPKALHNTSEKKLERNMMLHDARPPGCEYCWKIEDVGGRSDRIYRSGETWAQNARTDIFEAMATEDVDPRYVEVNFNQACNFKCMYCSPHLSTTWKDEILQDGPYDIIGQDGQPSKHNDIGYLEAQGLMPLNVRQDDNPYLQAFWKWWPDLYKKLEVLRMTGGEPLMDINTFKVLDYIYENPNAWLEVSVTSNMCPPKQDLMDKFINKLKRLEEIQIWQDKERFNPGSGNHWYVNMAIKNFAMFVSVDSVGTQAEYIRHGLKFDPMKQNVLRYLSETRNTTITFINTFNVLSVPKVTDFLKYILELRNQFSKSNQGIVRIPIYDQYNTHPDYEVHPRQRIWFDLPLLRYPDWQSLHILPQEFEKYLEDAIAFMQQHTNTENFAGFYDFEIAKLERNLAVMKERSVPEHKLTIDRANFVRFFEQYDQRHITNFPKTFPEFAEFYKQCKDAS